MPLLENKVAIVTGAGNGIGRSTALLFAREGARLVVCDVGCAPDGTGADPGVARSLAEEIASAGGVAVAHPDSVATPAGGRAVVEHALDEFGAVDVLVNHAGTRSDESLLEIGVDTWHRAADALLVGTLFSMQAAADWMRQRGAGRIVNTTGKAGLLGSFGQSAGSAAQAGVYGLTRSAAVELQRYGISVNAVAPVARTRQTAEQEAFAELDEVSPDHVAPAVLFLSSDLCGKVTGHVLAVAGPRLSVLRLVESRGLVKERDAGIWSAAEIAEHWSSIAKL